MSTRIDGGSICNCGSLRVKAIYKGIVASPNMFDPLDVEKGWVTDAIGYDGFYCPKCRVFVSDAADFVATMNRAREESR